MAMTIEELESRMRRVHRLELPAYRKRNTQNEEMRGSVTLWEPTSHFLVESLNQDLDTVPWSIVRHGRFSYCPLHTHDYFEMMYVYQGEVTHEVDGKKITLYAGDTLLLNPAMAHAVEMTGKRDIAINFLFSVGMFTEEFLEKLRKNTLYCQFFRESLTSKKGDYLLVRTENDPTLRLFIQHMLMDFYNPDFCTVDILDSILPVFFHLLYRVHRMRKQDSPKPARSANAMKDVSQMLRYIENNVATVTLAELAERFGYSYGHVSELLPKLTGKSFTELKQEAQMNQAADLLFGTKHTITTIMEKIGCKNKSFFYRTFQKYYHMTPAEFRGQKEE